MQGDVDKNKSQRRDVITHSLSLLISDWQQLQTSCGNQQGCLAAGKHLLGWWLWLVPILIEQSICFWLAVALALPVLKHSHHQSWAQVAILCS